MVTFFGFNLHRAVPFELKITFRPSVSLAVDGLNRGANPRETGAETAKSAKW